MSLTFHYDPSYQTDGVRTAMCHVSANTGVEGDLSPWGDYLCDAPWKLIEDGIHTLARNIPNPDFIIWTG